MIKQCFESYFHEIELSKLTLSKELPENVKHSVKYKQIYLSIKEIGLIEPIAVYINTEKNIKNSSMGT